MSDTTGAGRVPLAVKALLMAFASTLGMAQSHAVLAQPPTPAYATALRQAIAFQGVRQDRLSLSARMARWNVRGLSVAVIDNCRVVDARGFGMTREGGIAVRGDTLFQAASVTKPVAAFTALRLVDQKSLSLDSDVAAALNGWKPPVSPPLKDHPVTLRGILSHSAGLVPGGYGGYTRGEPLPTLLQTLDGIAPARPKPVQLAYTPGSDWRYSGGGYLVAQQLMIERTGQSFDQIVRKQTLDPVGMRRSGFLEPSTDADANVAAGHVADGSMVPGGWHVYPELAAAGLWSTADDMAAFGVAAMKAVRHEQEALLSVRLADQMATAQIGPRSLGFVTGGKGRARHLGHDGTNEGYNASLILYPETCQGAAIMANSDNAKPLIAELVRGIADTYNWPDAMPSAMMEPAAPTPAVIERFRGTYRFTDIADVAPFKIIGTEAGTFLFDRGDGHQEPLYPSVDGLVGPDSGIVIRALAPADGPAQTVSYARIGGRGAAAAQRVGSTR